MTIIKKWTVVKLVIIALLSSCTVNEIHEEYMNTFSQSYTVFKKDWNVGIDDDSGYYLYYEFSEPKLTQYIYEHGIMQAFLLMNDGNLTPLPFNDYWVDGDYMWTEQTTCEFRPGYITFILKYSDHAWDIPPYYDYRFRVRLMW